MWSALSATHSLTLMRENREKSLGKRCESGKDCGNAGYSHVPGYWLIIAWEHTIENIDRYRDIDIIIDIDIDMDRLLRVRNFLRKPWKKCSVCSVGIIRALSSYQGTSDCNQYWVTFALNTLLVDHVARKAFLDKNSVKNVKFDTKLC